MPFQQRAFFIGGPYDGRTMAIPGVTNDLTVSEFNLPLVKNGFTYRTRRYVKVHESFDGGTAVFEFEGHHEAVPSGVEAARVCSD